MIDIQSVQRLRMLFIVAGAGAVALLAWTPLVTAGMTGTTALFDVIRGARPGPLPGGHAPAISSSASIDRPHAPGRAAFSQGVQL
ncbi:hypothetical protein D3C77_436080 [compost metagenome]